MSRTLGFKNSSNVYVVANSDGSYDSEYPLGNKSPSGAPVGFTTIYEEDWESATLGSSGTGRGNGTFEWGGNKGSRFTSVSDDIAFAGSKSMRFLFDPSDSGQLSYDFGAGYKEVWQYLKLYIPDGTEGFGSAAYAHANDSPNNNKFFRMFAATTSDYGYTSAEKMGASLWYDSGYSKFNTEYRVGGTGGMTNNTSGGNAYYDDGIIAADLGNWVDFKIYVKAPTATTDGKILVYKDDVLIKDTDTDNYNTGPLETHNYQRGYFLGSTNADFVATTYLYMDDIKHYGKN